MPQKTLILIIFLLLSMSSHSFHIKLPNKYNLLYKKILLSQKTLNYSTQQFLSSAQKQSQLNEGNQAKLVYEVFLFPFRIYSFFNQKGKKVFLLDKVGIGEFQAVYQGKGKFQEEGVVGWDEDLMETQFNVRNCLYNSSSPCFSQAQLYQLIPQVLLLTPQPHQQLLLIPTPSHLLLKSQHPTSQSLYLIKLNLHRFIYQSRQLVLKHIYDMVVKRGDENYLVRMRRFFREGEVESVLGEKLGFEGLVEVRRRVELGRGALYSCEVTEQVFYLTEIEQRQCPDTSDILSYSLYVNSKPTTPIQKCTYLRLHKINLYQSTSPSTTQYISKSSQFSNIKSISSRFQKGNFTLQYFSQSKSFQIQYGEKWKSITKMDWQDRVLIQVLFLSDTKVYVFNNSMIPYKKRNNVWHEGNQVSFTDFLLTVQRLNNQHFVVCVEGSVCVIYNTQLKKMARLQFENAFGIQWTYKIDYKGNTIIAYVQALKRSASIHKITSIPPDPISLPLPPLPAGLTHLNYTLHSPSPFSFTFIQTISTPTILLQSQPNSRQIILRPTFSISQQMIVYRRERLFGDGVYSNGTRFKEGFLDDALGGFLGAVVKRAYFPVVSYGSGIGLRNNSLNKTQVALYDIYNPYKMQALFKSSCNFNHSTNTIHFIDNWNFCKVVINTDSMMVIDSIVANSTQNSPNLKQQTNTQTLTDKDYKKKTIKQGQNSAQQAQKATKQQQTPRYITMQAPDDQSQQSSSTQMIICVVKKDSLPHQQCKVTTYSVTKTFTKKKNQLKQLKFFLSSSERYFQIYFIRHQYESKEKLSFLQVLDGLAKDVGNQTLKGDRHVGQARILVNKRQDVPVDIVLRDYQQQERETISNILMVSYCVFIPVIALACCFVYYKNYVIAFLALYGFIQIPSNYTYPLSKMSLRLKKKQLQKSGYTKVYAKKPSTCQTIPIPNQEQSHIQQCCFCLQTIKVQQQILQLYCRHVFHSQCFFQWIKNQPNTKCPLCKRALTVKAMKQYQKLRKQNQKCKKQNQQQKILSALSEDSDVRNDLAGTNLSMIGD